MIRSPSKEMRTSVEQEAPYYDSDENKDVVDSESDHSGLQMTVTTTTRRCLQNLLIISFSYFLFFTGFWSLANLQSTMNAQQGMGPDSQAVIYLCSMVSCLFPQLMVEKFGAKTTYLVAILVSCPYLAANYHLRWDILMTTSILYGLVSGPLNTAMSIYLDEMSTRYKASVVESKENVKAFFFGVNVFFAESTQVLGNGLSYYVLERDKNDPLSNNFTMYNECGINFSPENENNTNLTPPTQEERIVLTTIYLVLGCMAVIFAQFMDPLKNDVKDIRGCETVSKTFFSAVRLLKNPHQLLLIPITIYIGIEGTFYANEFTEAFIACSWGVHHVGFVTICFGACGAGMAILVGPLVKYISQMSVIIMAAVINVVTCALLFVWEPTPNAPVIYFIFAGVWGMTDAIWWSQIAALYGLMFPNDREAAFSNFFFWSFLGYFLSYSYANYFTVAVKINIMLVFLVVGITLYTIGQVKIKCFSNRSAYVEIDETE